MMRKPRGLVLYEGPSEIDGKPIVCIATLDSRNRKTGNMVQTWILRQDVSPFEPEVAVPRVSTIGCRRIVIGDGKMQNSVPISVL